jgi:hypothetical protein
MMMVMMMMVEMNAMLVSLESSKPINLASNQEKNEGWMKDFCHRSPSPGRNKK